MAADAVQIGSRFSDSGDLTSVAGNSVGGAGHCFLIGLSFDNGATLDTVGDNKGNAYTRIGTGVAAPSRLELYRCENGNGGAGHTASAEFTGPSFGTIYLIEATGLLTSGQQFDQTAANQDGSSPYTVTTPTLGQADELIITLMGSGAAAPTYASSNTTIIDKEENGGAFWTSVITKAVAASTSAFTPSFTGGDGNSILIVATFKAAAAGGVTFDISKFNRPALPRLRM
jgi:hypothetical protein